MNDLYRRVTLSVAAVALMAPASFGVANAQEDITVAVPNPSALTWAPLWVAIGEGYFEEEGLEISVEAVDGSAATLQSMAAGQAQIGAPGPGPVLAAASRGEPFVFIYNLYPKSLFGLVVTEDSDYQQPADLTGETIGVGTADGAEVAFVRTILDDAGMEEGEDFEFLPVGDGGMATAAFTRADIEAYAAAVSDAAILNARGMSVREITPEEYLAYFGNGFATTEDYLGSNPDVIEGFGRALARGTEFMLDDANHETVLDHTTAGNPQEGEDREFAAALLDAVSERMTPTDAYADEGWGYMPPEHWELWQDSQVAAGALDGPLDDLQSVYTNDFVEAWNEGLGE